MKTKSNKLSLTLKTAKVLTKEEMKRANGGDSSNYLLECYRPAGSDPSTYHCIDAVICGNYSVLDWTCEGLEGGVGWQGICTYTVC